MASSGGLPPPMQYPDGTLQQRDRGTPQGSAVSPVLANLFLHYAFDAWMGRVFPAVPFERYADDGVVHCVSRRQAQYVRRAIGDRMAQVGLRLHPTRPGSCTARTAAGVAPGAHVLHVPGVHVPGPRSPWSSGERVRRVPPGDQQGGLETAQPHRAQVAAAPAHRAEPRRARRDDQPGRPRMDAVLRRVLPLRVVHAPGAHQHLPWCAGPARSTDGYVPTGRPAQPGTASPCSSPATSPTGRGSGTP
jgi:RNA-directed DNA polymerase